MTGPDSMSLGAKGRRFIQGVREKRAEEGTIGGLILSLRWAYAFSRKQVMLRAVRRYDARRGFDTAADFVESERPVAPAFDDAVFYAAIPHRLFGRVVKDIPIDVARHVFLDVGCGKGAALLHALDHGFRRVIGVELNERLADVASANLARHPTVAGGAGSAEVRRTDAALLELPAEPLVLYMYNPFGRETMTAVLGNLERSLRNQPRDVLIAYLSPVQHDVFDRSPIFRRLPTRSPRWAVWQSVVPADGFAG